MVSSPEDTFKTVFPQKTEPTITICYQEGAVVPSQVDNMPIFFFPFLNYLQKLKLRVKTLSQKVTSLTEPNFYV